MKDETQTNQNSQSGHRQVIVSACGLILSLLFLIGAALAWFSMQNGTVDTADYSVAKVDYDIPFDSTNLFFFNFVEQDDEDYVETPDIDEYVHADSVQILEKESGTAIAGSYDIQQDTKERLAGRFTKNGDVIDTCTDTLTWSSDHPENVSVSAFGSIVGVGKINSSATITLKVTNNEAGSDGYLSSIETSIIVRVVRNQSTGGDTQTAYADLSANTKILRTSFYVDNYSTVDTKVRLKLFWSYSNDAEGEVDMTQYHDYSIDTLMAEAEKIKGAKAEGPFSLTIGVSSPLLLTFTNQNTWTPVTPDGAVRYVCSDNTVWTATDFLFNDSQHAAFINYLAGVNPTFVLEPPMINAAYTYFSYGTTSMGDYGDKVEKVAANATEPAKLPVLDSILVSSSYSEYSRKKLYSIHLIIQARQYKAYVMNDSVSDSWFDVSHIGADYKCTYEE